MNSKEKILKNIKKNIAKKVNLPTLDIATTRYNDKEQEFTKNFLLAGGEITQKEKGIVLEGVLGVAENGAVLLKEVDDRKLYTFYEEITIVLDKNHIVNNMHEAYQKTKIDSFALFMAGPSKTADIEQSLVIGAHGAKRCYLLLS